MNFLKELIHIKKSANFAEELKSRKRKKMNHKDMSLH
jgi:hypothetical protein